ncbi:hypothetical protein AOLI_G00031470 [Acnodon oligacanthus]
MGYFRFNYFRVCFLGTEIRPQMFKGNSKHRIQSTNSSKWSLKYLTKPKESSHVLIQIFFFFFKNFLGLFIVDTHVSHSLPLWSPFNRVCPAFTAAFLATLFFHPKFILNLACWSHSWF